MNQPADPFLITLRQLDTLNDIPKMIEIIQGSNRPLSDLESTVAQLLMDFKLRPAYLLAMFLANNNYQSFTIAVANALGGLIHHNPEELLRGLANMNAQIEALTEPEHTRLCHRLLLPICVHLLRPNPAYPQVFRTEQMVVLLKMAMPNIHLDRHHNLHHQAILQHHGAALAPRHSYDLSQLIIRSWGEGAQLSLGSFCSIADRVQIFLGGNHRTDWVTTYPFGHIQQKIFPHHGQGHPGTGGHVIIGNDVWLGSGCTIMSGVTIGDGAVVAANAHVVHSVPPYTLVGGNPAKIIKRRMTIEQIYQLQQFKWFNLPDAQIATLVPYLCTDHMEATIEQIKMAYQRFFQP